MTTWTPGSSSSRWGIRDRFPDEKCENDLECNFRRNEKSKFWTRTNALKFFPLLTKEPPHKRERSGKVIEFFFKNLHSKKKKGTLTFRGKANLVRKPFFFVHSCLQDSWLWSEIDIEDKSTETFFIFYKRAKGREESRPTCNWNWCDIPKGRPVAHREWSLRDMLNNTGQKKWGGQVAWIFISCSMFSWLLQLQGSGSPDRAISQMTCALMNCVLHPDYLSMVCLLTIKEVSAFCIKYIEIPKQEKMMLSLPIDGHKTNWDLVSKSMTLNGQLAWPRVASLMVWPVSKVH